MKKGERLRRTLAVGGLAASLVAGGVSGKNLVDSAIDYNKALNTHPGTRIAQKAETARSNILSAKYALTKTKGPRVDYNLPFGDSEGGVSIAPGSFVNIRPHVTIAGGTVKPDPERAGKNIEEAMKNLNREIDPSGKAYNALHAARQAVPKSHSETNNYSVAQTHLEEAHNVVTPIMIQNRDVAYASARPYLSGIGRSSVNLLASIGAGIISLFGFRKPRTPESHLAVIISSISLFFAFLFLSPNIIGYVVSDTSPEILNRTGITALALALISLFVYILSKSDLSFLFSRKRIVESKLK